MVACLKPIIQSISISFVKEKRKNGGSANALIVASSPTNHGVERTVSRMADWQIEQVAVGIAVLVLFIHLAVWSRLCNRVTRLEALLKLLENEIKLIHEKDGDT